MVFNKNISDTRVNAGSTFAAVCAAAVRQELQTMEICNPDTCCVRITGNTLIYYGDYNGSYY